MKLTWQERSEKEAAERVVVAQTIATVAEILHGQIDGRDGRDNIIRTADYAIYVYHNTWKSRLHLSGTFPHEMELHRIKSSNHADPLCSITVSATRPAAQIAQEITRRIVPEYRALYAVLAERTAKYNTVEVAKDEQATRLAQAGRGEQLGERDPWRQADYYRTRYIQFGGKRFTGAPSGEAEVTGVGSPSISMKLFNLPPELAEYIASLLGEWAEDA